MPIVDIEFVGPDHATPQEYADALGDLFGGSSGTTWVRLRTLDRVSYAENGGPIPDEAQPVFVTVLHRLRPKGDELATFCETIAGRVSALSGRPIENIHLEFAEPAAGRVAFGGRLIE